MNHAKADRTHSDCKAIPQEIRRWQCYHIQCASTGLTCPFLLREITPSFMTSERVACRAAGKRTQLKWMWMVAERVCTALERRVP
jgi:hypothetical protein